MTKKALINKLDKLISEIIRSRGRCEVCGRTTTLQPHHIYSRSRMSVRWDKDNLCCLCSGCHTLSSKLSAHKTPIDFIDYITSIRGKEWKERLVKKAHQTKQWSEQELISLIKKLVKENSNRE